MARRIFLLLHRYAGLFMALFLVVAGLSGAVIAFYDELDASLNPQLYRVKPLGSSPLPLDKVVEQMEQGLLEGRALIRYTRFPRHENDSISFFLTPKRDSETGKKFALDFNSVFVDPYTGNVLGTRQFGAWRLDRAHIMPLLWELHYSLTLPGPYGEWLFGGVALIWVFDCFFAAYLTLPRRRKKFMSKWRKAWQIKFNAGASQVFRDVHVAFSLWLWGMLLMLAVSGVMFNLGKEVYSPLLSSLVEYEYVRDSLPSVNAEARKNRISLEEARQRGREYIRIWQQEKGFEVFSEDSLTLDLAKYAYRYKVKSSLGLPEAYAQTFVYLSAADGRLLARSHPYVDTGNAISSWLAALHMGRVFGLWYQIVICVLGLVVTAVSITGVLIWWRKRKRKLSSEKYSEFAM